MVETFVKHKVEDFAKWKAVYDEFAPTAKARGVTADHVYRDPDAPDNVIVTHEFNTLKAARDFFGSEDLKSAMTKAGVSSAPEIWFGEEIN
ncbi:antibiotic biosynthesis monooxygenase [Sunxiuqinia sp. A32]|uniref:antibiotic biosynthesis monooxygenase n=1 Tax=Sunxiuqinia sp. A32 TaxID=3461496 RepID=UPI004045E2A9